jgi:hypothetical protein
MHAQSVKDYTLFSAGDSLIVDLCMFSSDILLVMFSCIALAMYSLYIRVTYPVIGYSSLLRNIQLLIMNAHVVFRLLEAFSTMHAYTGNSLYRNFLTEPWIPVYRCLTVHTSYKCREDF